MKLSRLLCAFAVLVGIATAADAQTADSTGSGRLWGSSARVQPAVQPYIPPPSSSSSGGWSTARINCVVYVYGPPNTAFVGPVNNSSGKTYWTNSAGWAATSYDATGGGNITSNGVVVTGYDMINYGCGF